jgi:glycosyltransferase involved in cell wall biosynthesis
MSKFLSISIITVTLNSGKTIQDCLNSVSEQSYKNIDHIIIDGLSSDGTLSIINNNIEKISIFKSEADSGIYDALNKGFELSRSDIIGILHSDDVFYDDKVLEKVVMAFNDQEIDYAYGDIEMIDADGRLVRYWRTGLLPDGKIKSTQIPHPALFLSRKLIERITPIFDTSYRIAADLKQQLIFANILNAKCKYIPSPLVKMKIGGTSTVNFQAYFKGWKESRRAWNEVHGNGGGLYVCKKILSKIKSIKV